MDDPTFADLLTALLLHPVFLAGLAGVILLPVRWAIRWGFAAMLIPVVAILSVSGVHFFGLQDRIMPLDLAWWSVIILGALTLIRGQMATTRAPEFTLSDDKVWVRNEIVSPTPDNPAPWRDRADMVLAVAYAAVLAGAAFWRAAWYLDGAKYGYLWHAGFGIAALIALWAAHRKPGAVMRAGCASFAITTLGLTTWGAIVFPAQVRAAAEKIADGAPYCIDLREDAGGVQSMGDLSFLTMPKPDVRDRHIEWERPPYSPYLVVERQGRPNAKWKTTSPILRYFWSQATAAFVQPEDYDDPRIYAINCIPRLDYLRNLPRNDAAEILIHLPVFEDFGDQPTPESWLTQRLRIPYPFDPDATVDSLSIKVVAPDFTPPHTGDSDPATNWAFIHMTGRGGFYHAPMPDDVDMAAMPIEGGLHIYTDDKGTRWYAAITPSGDVTTAIKCGQDVEVLQEPDPNCTQYFAAANPIDGRQTLIVYFSYPPALLPQWQVMEAPLAARIASFFVLD
jgi:hypothetical protein